MGDDGVDAGVAQGGYLLHGLAGGDQSQHLPFGGGQGHLLLGLRTTAEKALYGMTVEGLPLEGSGQSGPYLLR